MFSRSITIRSRIGCTLVSAAAIASFVIGHAVCAEDPAGPQTKESTADLTARRLLDALEEREMPDVSLWVLKRIEDDQSFSKALKDEVPFRRATSLVGTSRKESDSKKRTLIFDQAEKEVDRFLQGKPTGNQAIAAYTQKGNLLIERGRAKVEQSKRPGEDAKTFLAESLPFFDGAIKSLEGPKRKPGEEIVSVENAEDAVLESLRKVDAELKELQGDEPKPSDDAPKGGPGKPKKVIPKRKSSAVTKKMEQLEEQQDLLRGQLLSTRLLIAAAYFEKSKAMEPQSKEWTATVEKSAADFRELYEKYRSRGAGLFARYYEGRNYAVLAQAQAKPEEKQKLLEKALVTLGDVRVLDGPGFVPGLRAKAINTSLECWLEAKKYEEFDERLLKIALGKIEKIDADWLGMKYRAAVLLERRSDALPEKEKIKKGLQLRDAKKLATEVAKAGKDFSKESRALLEQLGKQMPEDADGGAASFETAMDAAKLSLASMQTKLGEAKLATASGKAEVAEAAKIASAADRVKTIEAIRKAIPLAGAEDIDALNQARYLLTFLLYDSRRLHDAATLGAFLAERYPNAKGSRQAAKIAMASWQQLAKDGPESWRVGAKAQCADVVELIMRTWPDDVEGGDAAMIAIAAATEARDPDRLLSILSQVPAASPRRADVLMRVGGALWREVLEKRRLEEGVRPTKEVLRDWKKKASDAIDDGLKAIPPTPMVSGTTPAKTTVAAALARCQMAIEDGDNALVNSLFDDPSYGPWIVANGSDPGFTQGQLAENILTVALRYFIQAEQIDKAQEAMKKLETVAGDGEEASAKLTGMYQSMGRDLQSQLIAMGAGDRSGTPESEAKAAAILGGFEKFLDGVEDRDPKVPAQMWVATTYLSLGSGKGTGTVVPKAKAEGYLARAAEVYEKLLKTGGEEISKFEPSIRLKMSALYGELGKWDDAQGHLDWILSDPKRQNSLDTQIQAAELLQAAGEKSADKAKADQYFKEAIVGRKSDGANGKPAVVVWGWGGIANKLARQAFSGSDEKSLEARKKFFNARLNVAKCRLARAEASASDRQKLLEMAVNDIRITVRLYPELGGPSMMKQFEKILKEIQKLMGSKTNGWAAFEESDAGAVPPAPAAGS